MTGAGVMRVGVNLCWVVPGVVGGSEDLLVGWLTALATHPDVAGPAPRVELTVFGSAALAEAHPVLRSAFRYVTAPVQGTLRGLRVLTETTWLAAQSRRRRLDVVHQAGGVVPPLHPGRNALTVHDIQPLELPQHFSPIKRRYLALALPRSVRAADVVIATSTFVVDGLVGRLGADRSRCHVVAPVLRTSAGPPLEGPRMEVAELEAVRARHGIGAHYVLYPAVAYPHKNHRVLYEAMRRLPDRLDAQLVLTGGDGPLDTWLAGFVADHGLEPRIRRLGRVPEADYVALLTAADALVFPSRYEGFGLGAFDALAVGTPVVAADIAPLREVLGPDGVVLDPDDPAAWAAHIAELTGDAASRAAAAARSVARARSFSGRRSADALLGAYRAAAGAAPGPVQAVRSQRPGPVRPDTAPERNEPT